MTNILLQLSDEQKLALKNIALQNGIFVNQLIRQLIKQFLHKKQFEFEFA